MMECVQEVDSSSERHILFFQLSATFLAIARRTSKGFLYLPSWKQLVQCLSAREGMSQEESAAKGRGKFLSC